MKTLLLALMAIFSLNVAAYSNNLVQNEEVTATTASSVTYEYDGELVVTVNGSSSDPATTHVKAVVENGKLSLYMGAITIFGQTVYTTTVTNIIINDDGTIPAAGNESVPVTAVGFTGLTAAVAGNYALDGYCSLQLSINNVAGKTIGVSYIAQ